MGIGWCGWAPNGHNRGEIKPPDPNPEPVSQESEPFQSFSASERTIAGGLVTIEKPGTKAPWLSPFGACLVKVYGIRRNPETNRVEFGIGNEKPPILGWVTEDKFYDEWPQ